MFYIIDNQYLKSILYYLYYNRIYCIVFDCNTNVQRFVIQYIVIQEKKCLTIFLDLI